MNDYEITRKGNMLVITTPKGTKQIVAAGAPSDLPGFAVEMIRKAGANPDNYLWLNGTPIRKSHADAARKLIAEAREEHAKSPEGLRAKRAELLARIRGCDEEARAARNRAWETGNESAGVRRNDWDTRANEARAALNEFDAAHPEVVAAVAREKAERAESFSRTN